MTKRKNIKKVSPLGVLLRVITYIVFIYSIYQIQIKGNTNEKFLIYVFIYIMGFSYFLFLLNRKLFKIGRNNIFKIIVSFISFFTFFLLVDGLINFSLSTGDTIKKDIYALFLIFMTFSLLLFEYSFFVSGIKRREKNRRKKTKEKSK